MVLSRMSSIITGPPVRSHNTTLQIADRQRLRVSMQ
jgi:hypothetical protein